MTSTLGPPTCDVAVVGLGVMGCAAVHDLSCRGKTVHAFEQFDLGHNRGSSHGESRAIRMAYFEGPHYVALLREAYRQWDAFQGPSGALFQRVGMLEAGYRGSEMVEGVRSSARLNGLELSSREILTAFPRFRIPDDWDVAFEQNAGYLRPELIAAEFLRRARETGAHIHPQTRVTNIRPRAGGVAVDTSRGTVEAGAVIVVAGPWMTGKWLEDLLPGLRPRLRLTRQTTAWFQPRRPELFAQMPVFGLEVAKDEIFYGFPDMTGAGVKVATHARGIELADADDPARPATPDDSAPLEAFLREYIPDAAGPVTQRQTCVYTNTQDGEFLIDRLATDPRVVFASACSGHGYKFASILGPILADLSLGDEDRYKRFEISRFALNRRAPHG
jgi:sarcosine oxidase